MQPSDSLDSLGLDSGLPLPSAYLAACASSLPRPSAWPRLRRARGPEWCARTDNRLLVVPGCSQGESGSPRCLGHPLRARRCHAPRQLVRSHRPDFGDRACCLRGRQPFGLLGLFISRLKTQRLTRSRTYASPASLPSPSQGSLPAGRAAPWPGGICTRWTTSQSFMPYASTFPL